MGIIGDVAALFGDGGDSEQARRILEQMNAEAGPSAFSKISEDPSLRTDQLSSLSALKSIANGGMRTEDRVAEREAIDAANRNEQAQRQAVLQSMAARGLGGGGLEFASQLQAQQGGANRANDAGSQAAANASRRALQAVGQYGTMAGQVRGQDYDQAARTAQQQDVMSRFNAGQRVQKAGMVSGIIDSQGERARQRWQNVGNDAENIGSAAYGKWG